MREKSRDSIIFPISTPFRYPIELKYIREKINREIDFNNRKLLVKK